MKKHRFFNMYMTTTISIALVLFMIGMLCGLFVVSSDLSRQVKENMAVSVELTDTVGDEALGRMEQYLAAAPFVKSYDYISREAALEEHIKGLGEDPTEFLGYNPLRASFELKVKSDYVQSDSLKRIEAKLKTFPVVDRVVYQSDLTDEMNHMLGRLSLVLLGGFLVLLLIAVALINNTIRLGIYSKRFLIHTMRLVGATGWTIRRPFVRRNMLLGLIAAVLAIGLLAGVAWYLQSSLGFAGLLSNYRLVVGVPVVVVVVGVCLTALAANHAAGRYVRMETNDLYYV